MATAALGPGANLGGSPTALSGKAVSLYTKPDFGNARARSKLPPRRASLEVSQEGSAALTPVDEDPLRKLAPAQKKLTTVEAQRVLATMDEAMKRTERALVIPFLTDSLERFSFSLGAAELVALLQEYRQLSSEYADLHERLVADGIPLCDDDEERLTSSSSLRSRGSRDEKRVMKPGQLEPPDSALEEQFYNTQHKLRHCTKSILRELGKNPSIFPVLQAASRERSQMAVQLVEAMGTLREVVLERLLTTRLEEVQREELLQEVAEQQETAEEQISKLEAELEDAQKRMGDEVASKTALIKRLETDIKTVKKLAEENNRRVRAEATKQQTASQSAHENKKTKLQESIASHQKQLKDHVTNDREKEQELRKRAFKRETEVENWIQKYDNEVGEKQEEFEILDEEFTKEKQELKELEEKLGILTIEYDMVIREQEEARARAEEADRRLKMEVRAARIIQRAWKQYRKHKMELKALKKKGKGKGAKGKGKGKKKK